MYSTYRCSYPYKAQQQAGRHNGTYNNENQNDHSEDNVQNNPDPIHDIQITFIDRARSDGAQAC